jgi:hypothetical protein
MALDKKKFKTSTASFQSLPINRIHDYSTYLGAAHMPEMSEESAETLKAICSSGSLPVYEPDYTSIHTTSRYFNR